MTAPTAQAATNRAQANITPELIRDALAHIPATLPRDDWAKVAMAIKSEFPDTSGEDLFTNWSATAEGHDRKDALSTWRSVKAGGGVRIGTLLQLAKANGFTLLKAGHALTPPSPEVLAKRERDRIERQQREQVCTEAAQAASATVAAAMWAHASDTGGHPYLTRKGVQPHGVRFGADGLLLVPVRDGTGKLWNVQSIAPEKAPDGVDKLFQKGARQRNLWVIFSLLNRYLV